MLGPIYFVQECPVCGRRLQVRVQDLGKVVACRHCRGRFEALGQEPLSARQAAPTLLDRAEELLASAEARKARPR